MQALYAQIISGVATGAIYSCMALAIVMIYKAIGHINFAQGEMAMFSTFVAWQLLEWGLPYWLVFILALFFAFFMGVAIERTLFRPLARASALTHVAGFIALYIGVNSIAGLIWGFNLKEFPTPFGSSPFMGSRFISTHQVVMIGASLILLLLLYVFFQRSKLGLAMRAAALHPESARLMGIRVDWMISLGWGMASVVGALAGMLIAPVVFLDVNMMTTILLYGFAAAVLGGLGSPLGAVVGGILVGVSENLIGSYLPSVGNELKFPIALGLIVVMLLIRPQGLLQKKTTERV